MIQNTFRSVPSLPCRVDWSRSVDGYVCIYLAFFQVDGSCNVNWTGYSPEGDGPASTMLATFGRMVAYFVVLFPAMDVTSVYPLNVMVGVVVLTVSPGLRCVCQPPPSYPPTPGPLFIRR